MKNLHEELEWERISGSFDLENCVSRVSYTRCLIPWKQCWDSKKYLFMKKCVKVTCSISGPGDDIYTFYYFEPKYWTLRALKP